MSTLTFRPIPIQFAKRQLYQIEQISFPPQQNMEALAASTKDFKSLDQVETKLNELNIKFSRGTGAMDTATLPPEIQKAIEARKPEDIFFIRSRTSASFFKVTSVEEKPLTGDEADQFAKRQLREDLAKKSAQDTFTAALATAKYEGDYARIMRPRRLRRRRRGGAGRRRADRREAAAPNGAKPEDKEAPKN